MKVALCFIISYEHKLNKEQLWIDWIKPNQDIINIYFHYKDINKIKSPWIKLYTIPPKFIQPTTYYDVVPAYMSILSYAYEQDKDNLWFCLLTDSCVPIITPTKFREIFLNHYQASIIKCKPAYWNVTIHRRANLRLLSKEFWLANDPWFTLCRDHVNKCMLFFVLKTELCKQINIGGLANESIFAIILQSFGELQQSKTNPYRLINESATLSDWTRMASATSPYLFKDDTPENMTIISNLCKENKYAMFLRKVHSSFPDSAIKNIMSIDFNHKYDALYKQAKKKNKSSFFFESIKYFIIFIALIYFITSVHTEILMSPSIFTYYM